MNILVTGHRGFIGSNLIKRLKELGHRTTGYEWGEQFPGYEYDWIVHLGAISSTNEKNVDKLISQNYQFSVWLFETCKRYGINLQYASSAGVYGNSSTFSESDQVIPMSPYAWTKYLFEKYVHSKNYSLIAQGFRYFNVHGPGEEHKSQPSPYELFSRQDEITLFKGSENIKRDFVPVEKVVQTHVEFFKVPESGVWNIGSGRATSFLEVAQTFNKPIRYVDMPEDLKKNYQYYTCADLTKLRDTINRYNLDIPE